LSDLSEKKKKLVIHLEKNGYIQSDKVKEAMLNVPREFFVPLEVQSQAYDDSPLPTFIGQTISAPHMNAMMCELLDLQPGDRVLEIGTGSGYHAALVGYIVSKGNNPGHVYTIERINELFNFASDNLRKANLIDVVTCIYGDGTLGHPQSAPYDKILVTAAGPQIPKPLLDQLAEGGKLCIPIGNQRWSQKLLLVTKKEGKIQENEVSSVVFVPLIGEYGFESNSDN
jgi:protein-L-isoaspartate(D-aspartate) O-methyltransferase